MRPRPQLLPILWASLALGLYAAALLFRLSLPVAIDPVEVTVAQLSYLSIHHQPVYTGVLDAGRYSLLYGPLCYLPYGLALALSPTLTALKVTLALLNVATFAVLWASFRRILPAAETLVAIAFLAAAFMLRQMTMFLIRGDIELALAVALAFYAVTLRRTSSAVALFAVAATFAVDIKFTAVFYLLVPFYFLARRQSWRAAIVTIPLTGLLALLPFALPNLSLANYIAWIHEAGRHPLSARLFAINLVGAAILLVPPVLLFLQLWFDDRARAAGYLRQHSLLVVLLLLGVAGSTITGSKVGAGRSHLACTFIVSAYIAAILWTKIDWHRKKRELLRYSLALYSIFLLIPAVNQLRDMWSICVLRRGYARSVNREIAALQRQHPQDSIEIGYGESPDPRMPVDSSSFFRPQLVFAGNPVSVDAGALFDMGLSGLPIPPATVAAVRACRPTLWLIPRGQQPFRVTNIYVPDVPSRFPDPHLFSPEFQQAFLSTYRKIGSSNYFDLWQCSQPTQ